MSSKERLNRCWQRGAGHINGGNCLMRVSEAAARPRGNANGTGRNCHRARGNGSPGSKNQRIEIRERHNARAAKAVYS